MDLEKYKSIPKKVKKSFVTTIENISFIKNKTTDVLLPFIDKVKVLICKVTENTAVFFDTAAYETKGMLYNTYDKCRDLYRKMDFGRKSPDYIAYRGEPEPSIKQRISALVKVSTEIIKGKLPKNSDELTASLRKNYTKSRRFVRRAYLASKENAVIGFHILADYTKGIKKSTVAGLGAIAVGGFVFTFILSTIVSSYAMGVTINGEKVGFVESEEELSALVEGVKQEISRENHDASIEINDEVIKLDSMAETKNKVTMLDEQKLKEKLIGTDVVVAKAASVNVNGQPVVYVASHKDANNILESIKQKYDVFGQDVVKGFREDVEVSSTAVTIDQITPTADAITYLLTGNKTIKQYKVKENDTNWDIAVANGLTEKDIAEANPDMNTEVIKKGDIINISKMVPFVHMEVSATVNITEKVNYKTEQVETDQLYEGETEVQKDGKRGDVSVTKRAIYVNGKETNAEVIEKNIVKEPENRVVLVGTKQRPVEQNTTNNYSGNSSNNSSGGSNSSQSPVYKSGGGSYTGGSGRLGKPMRNMEMSSPFGSRNGRNHSGADYRNPAGTAIYAAEGGKVIYSGYDGAYGNTVRISHGNGMTTVYAHCKSLYVKKGASVKKGQQIATVGRTGRATGNHLHFEVRINGVAKNPQNYL